MCFFEVLDYFCSIFCLILAVSGFIQWFLPVRSFLTILTVFHPLSSHCVSVLPPSKNQIAKLTTPKEANEKTDPTTPQCSAKPITPSKHNNATTSSAGVYLTWRR